MPTIADELNEDLKTAMKARDSLALAALRALKSALKNAAIEKGGADVELDEGEAIAIVHRQIKQRRDSIEQFRKGDRNELADREAAEIVVLERYLPAALSEAEIGALVTAAITETGATGRADMGKVMKILQERAAGRADGKTLSQAVMQALSANG